MSEKIKVMQNDDSRFVIVHRNEETCEEKFFGGFYNETENVGTEDELQGWDNENWVDCIDDGAILFSTFNEANDFMLNLKEDEDECFIVLYGRGELENSQQESHWYPLKMFS